MKIASETDISAHPLSTPVVAEAAQSRVSEIVRAIVQRIRRDGLLPGQELPSEAVLMKELNASRTVVREGFRSLSALGLIDVGPGRRPRVSEIKYDSLTMVLEHGVLTEQIRIQQIFDVRRTLEMRTAVLAALHRTPSEAEQILHHAQAMQTYLSSDPARVKEHDVAMHRAIAEASRNPVYALIIAAFSGVTRQTWEVTWQVRKTLEIKQHSIDGHMAIANAIRNQDTQAAEIAMANHFDESLSQLVKAGMN